MADRVARVVWEEPRRRIGFGAGLAAAIVAAVLLTGVLSTSSTSARSLRATGQSAKMSAINGKVNALIAKMTVSEKFGQLEMAGPDGANGTPGPKLLAGAQSGTIGTVLDLVGVDNINQAQQAALQSRLHIPLIFGLDVIHGYKTMFPVPIGEASELGSRRRPARRVGVGVARRPPTGSSGRSTRWSTSAATRAGDGWSREPARIRSSGSAIAAAKVRGYQGNDFSAPNKMAATVKHFAGYGAPVAGREYNTVDMSVPAARQRLPAAVQGRGRRRGSDRDERVQLPQRRSRECQPVAAADDPAPGVGIRRHRGQ